LAPRPSGSGATPVFDGIKESRFAILKAGDLSEDGKSYLYDGRSGERSDQRVVVGRSTCSSWPSGRGQDHARAVGPYSLVTQRPLAARRVRGQRFGEMEVWAMESLRRGLHVEELLTVKSDDVPGRTRIYEIDRQRR